ncbi:MAG: hypothetical protein KGQ36_00060 [Rickettsiales bacterium]|nr:hypothetical protein [Rickettsiales bacterium]
MKQQNQDLMLDEFLSQILQYRSRSELLQSLSIAKNDSQYLLKLSQGFDYIFKQYSHLIFQTVNKKSAFDEQIIKNINQVVSLVLKVLDESCNCFEEKEKSDLRNFIKNNCETFSKLKEDALESLLQEERYYVKIVTILELGGYEG